MVVWETTFPYQRRADGAWGGQNAGHFQDEEIQTKKNTWIYPDHFEIHFNEELNKIQPVTTRVTWDRNGSVR